MASTCVDLFPQGAWDTHHHIFEPDVFPYSADRHLTPPAATVEAFAAFKRKLGITRSVLTHGLSYGDDCTSLLAFIPSLGKESTRGIGVIEPETVTDEELQAMHKAGVRGVRINLYRYRAMEDLEGQKKALLAHASRIAKAGLPWSVTMTTIRVEFWDELGPFIESTIAKYGVQVVSDHFCLLKGSSMLPAQYRTDPTSQPGFQAVINLVRNGHLWVKLSAPYRISEMKPDFGDLEYLVRALFDANKHMVLLGTDWPHTPRMKVRSAEDALKESPYMEVDDEAWFRRLKGWLTEEEWRLLTVENPSKLFDQ